MGKRNITLLAIGAALSLLLGSGLLSLVSDSVTSTGNALETGAFTPTPPPSHDLVGRLSSINSGCGQGTFTDGPLAAQVESSFDLNSSGVFPSTVVCVRNNGDADGKFTIRMVDVVQTEVEDCLPSEGEANDQSCAHGEEGELTDVIQARVFSPGFECNMPLAAAQFLQFVEGSTAEMPGTILSGQTCELRFDYFTLDASDDQKLRAQTDRVQWNFVFTLEDPPNPNDVGPDA